MGRLSRGYCDSYCYLTLYILCGVICWRQSCGGRTSVRRAMRSTRLVASSIAAVSVGLGRFDGFHAVPAAVSKTCLVQFDKNKYSVSVIAHLGLRQPADSRPVNLITAPRVPRQFLLDTITVESILTGG